MEETEKPTLKMILDSAIYVTKQYISKVPDTVISITEDDEKWVVVVEVIERKAVPDTQDILGRYKITLDKYGELQGWRQVLIRRRSEAIETE